MLASLENQTIFKQAFTDKVVFEQFAKDIFGIDIIVDKIETEKEFDPKVGHINFKIDIFAESVDHRVIIEIQKIEYDYHFDRFLHYFMMSIAEQQRKAKEYNIEQQVFGAVILTRPYKINQKTGIPIRSNVLVLDIDPKDLHGEKVNIWGHNLTFLNPHPKYRDLHTPKNYQDWLDLFYASIKENNNDTIQLNLNNKGIAKAVDLIEFENLDGNMIESMKIEEGKRRVLIIEKEEGIKEGIEKGIFETAKNAIIEGLSNDVIKKITKLTDQQVNEVRNQINYELTKN